MNSKKIWFISLALSVLLHGTALAVFLINKSANENFLDGINADIGEFASVSFVANLPVGELSNTSIESTQSSVEETSEQEKIEEQIVPEEIEKSPVEVAKQEEISKPKEIKKPKISQKQTKIDKVKSQASNQSTASAPVSSDNVGEFKTQIQGSSNSAVKKSWQGLVLSHIFKFKTYPKKALEDEFEGIATVKVSIDKNGNVLSSEIKKSTKFAILDNAAREIFKKASPLPAPPPEIIGTK